MIRPINVYDGNLQRTGIISNYTSLIWAQRFIENGDCELYLPATKSNISLLKNGNYLGFDDEKMLCVIRKTGLKTDLENGDYIIATGEDVKSFCDQRILWGTFSCNGSPGTWMQKRVEECLIKDGIRQLQKTNGSKMLSIGSIAETPSVQYQASYKNLGETIRDFCKTYGYGHRFRFVQSSSGLYWDFQKGTDRTATVRFSPKLFNVKTTDYVEDSSKQGNVILVGGEEVGPNRKAQYVGIHAGVDRFEKFLDKKSNQKQMTFEELKEAFPGGQVLLVPDGSYRYYVFDFTFAVPDGGFEGWIRSHYGGTTWTTIDGVLYCTISQAELAICPSSDPESGDNCELRDLPYYIFLVSDGVEELAKYGVEITFDAEIVPEVNFTFGKDYFLGDYVAVENEYGISKTVQITEVIDVWDENGHSLQIKYE